MNKDTKKAIIISTLFSIMLVAILFLIPYFMSTLNNYTQPINDNAKDVVIQFIEHSTNLYKENATQNDYYNRDELYYQIRKNACEQSKEFVSLDTTHTYKCYEFRAFQESFQYSNLVLSKGENIKIKEYKKEKNRIYVKVELDIVVDVLAQTSTDSESDGSVQTITGIKHIDNIELTLKKENDIWRIEKENLEESLANFTPFWIGYGDEIYIEKWRTK